MSKIVFGTPGPSCSDASAYCSYLHWSALLKREGTHYTHIGTQLQGGGGNRIGHMQRKAIPVITVFHAEDRFGTRLNGCGGGGGFCRRGKRRGRRRRQPQALCIHGTASLRLIEIVVLYVVRAQRRHITATAPSPSSERCSLSLSLSSEEQHTHNQPRKTRIVAPRGHVRISV